MNSPDPLSLTRTLSLLEERLERGEKAAVVLVLGHPDSELIGGRVLIGEADRLGSLGSAEWDGAAEALARDGLGAGSSTLPGIHSLAGGTRGEVSVYLELHHPAEELVVVGAGHLAQPLCSLGALLGLVVKILDDRPEFATRERFPEAAEVLRVDFSDPFRSMSLHPWSHVVLVTRGHRYDYECLRRVLQQDPLPGYIGMIGSRRRVKATFQALLEEGFSRDLLHRVHAPIGLDIQAQTPAEIAISVAAEIVHHWRGGTGKPLSEKETVLERLLPEGPSVGGGQGKESG